MIDFLCPDDNFKNDLMELVRAFEQRTDKPISLAMDYSQEGSRFLVSLTSIQFDYAQSFEFSVDTDDATEKKRLQKRYLKESIYHSLCLLSGEKLPYGSLTGIRPTKLYCELGDKAHDMFVNEFLVSADKVDLIEKTVRFQAPIRNHDEDGYDVFVFIPFCPTRCAYCSFVSVAIDRTRKLVEPYVECLLKELEFLKQVVRIRKIRVRSVYIGGGTPTSIPVELLDKILYSCQDFNAPEFTVEAGRPDTVTAEVLRVLSLRGVTRISINPQTFNDKTLALIGRKHSADDVERVYREAKGLFEVNMDLIAALPGESLDDFKKSVDKAVQLSPENVTVHTLYLKKGSALKLDGYHAQNAVAEDMVNYAYRRLSEAGYYPYYMYRQKYTSGNLENVGYAKPDHICVYNVDIMEEDTSILAAGAGAISKKWTKSINLIERNANYKEPLEYVKGFETVLERQKAFWLQ